jgi:hypothetical protein
MKTSEIKSALLQGHNFQNELAGWFTLINVNANRFIIEINGKTNVYKNVDSAAKRINQLTNRGY